MTWNIFGYELGWYWKKIYFCLPVHILLGAVNMLIVHFYIRFRYGINDPILNCILTALSIYLGSCIEWTQNDYAGREWADRHKWLLGSVRDVVFYAGAAWVMWI